jgi:clan AA aspartic protease (TIGR02281 family)
MRLENSFEIDGDLIIVHAVAVGARKQTTAQLVLDTGSTLTTLSPAIARAIGCDAEQRIARSVVRSAVAEERGYIIRLSRLHVIGVRVTGMPVNIADLGHHIDGLLGMDFLSILNFEIRPKERRILIERATS